MIQLLKENSALDAKNIRKLKLCDDAGIWTEFPQIFYINADPEGGK
jgi:hypothetical protein